MEGLPLRSYRHEFTRHAQWRADEKRRVLDQINRQEDKKQERERERSDDHDAFMDFAFGFILATDSQIAAFTVKLDTYDAATIEALMENERALERVQEDLRLMLEKAYVLPDGRRVFKTEDGFRVFDEHGEEITGIDPDEIEDWRPRWEGFNAAIEERTALENERQQILDYQAELDEARERTAEEGLTEAELEEMEQRLERNMPDAVKRQLAGEAAPSLDGDQPAMPQQQATFQPAGKLDMPSL